MNIQGWMKVVQARGAALWATFEPQRLSMDGPVFVEKGPWRCSDLWRRTSSPVRDADLVHKGKYLYLTHDRSFDNSFHRKQLKET